MLPFGVTIPTTVPQRSEIPEGLTNYPVLNKTKVLRLQINRNFFIVPDELSIPAVNVMSLYPRAET